MVRSDLAVLIPAYNEGPSIGAIVRELSRVSRVVVVDDGSTDGTSEIASASGAHVVTLDFNRGYDAALTAGIEFLMGCRIRGFVTCDADGQHAISDVVAVLGLVENDVVVIGNRKTKARFAEKICGAVSNHIFGITDPLCGLKGYAITNMPVAPGRLMLGSTGMGLAISLVRKGIRVRNVRVEASSRTHGTPRFGNSVLANYKILFSFSRVVWRSIFWGKIETQAAPGQTSSP